MIPHDRPEPLPAKIVAALDRLARAQRAHRQAAADRLGVSPLQLEVLRTLADDAPPEPLVGQIATELSVRQPTVTDSVRALETKGLLRRDRDPGDARRSLLSLTESGERVVAEASEADGALVEAVGRLDQGTQEETLEGLLSLIASMVDTGVITVARTCLTCRFHQAAGPTGHHCTLLETELPAAGLRVNCPEHRPLDSGRAS